MVDYTLLHSTTSFLPATASVAAGAALVDGWVDIAGGAYGTDSGGVLRRIADDSSNYLRGQLLRPASENTQDGRIVYTASATLYQRFYAIIRSNRASDGTATAYAVGFELDKKHNSEPYVAAYKLVNGVTTWFGDANTVFGTTNQNGTPITCQVDWTQTNSSTTTFVVTLTDSSGKVLGTKTLTDTEASLQNVDGSVGLACYSYKGGAGNTHNEAGLTAFSDYTAATVTKPFSTYTLTGPATLTVGAASTFTLTPGAGAALAANAVFTLATTLTGTLSAQTVTIPAGSTSPVTFTLKPSASGSGTLSVTNNARLTDPAALSLTAGTSVQKPTTCTPTVTHSSVLIGSHVGVTFTLDHPAVSEVTVSPWCSVGTGSFSPSSLTIAAGSSSVTTQFTPSSVANTLISANLSDRTITASRVNVQVTQPTTVVPVDSAAFCFSPGDWSGDTGRGGSAYRRSIWNGSWFRFTWTAGATAPSAVIKMGNSRAPNYVNVFVNGAPQLRVAANADITLNNVVAGAQNTVELFLSYTDPTTTGWASTDRWGVNSVGNVVVDGVQLDSASAAATAQALRPYVVMINDSIGEGVHANNVVDQASNFYGDNGCAHTFMLGRMLDEMGYDYSLKAAGGIGFIKGPGDGNVPAWNSCWNLINAGTSVLDSAGHWSAYGDTATEPAAFLLDLGYNDASHTDAGTFQKAIVTAITNLRSSAPDADILVVVPFCMRDKDSAKTAFIPVFAQAVAAYQAANPTDGKVSLVDMGDSVARMINLGSPHTEANDKDHPSLLAHSWVAPRLGAHLASVLGGWGAAPAPAPAPAPTPTPSTNERVYTFS